MIIDIQNGIQCGGYKFTIKMDGDTHRLLRSNNNNGECDCNNLTISLDNDMESNMFSKTFIHEIIEAVNYIYCDNKVEHEKIQQLSFGIHQVMESLGVRFGCTYPIREKEGK